MVSVKAICVVFLAVCVLQSYAQKVKLPLKAWQFKKPPSKGPIWKSGDWSLGKGGLNFRRWSLGGDGLKHTFRNGISVFGKPDLKFSFKKPFVKVNVTIVDDDDVEDKRFEASVAKYPSSFDLKLDCLTKTRIQTLRDTLIGKLDNGFVLVDEKIQVYNLISYLSFKLKQLDLATEYNRKALQTDRRNGIALANRARYNKNQHNYFDAEEDLKRLEKLYEDDNAAITTKLLAEGEIILSYARFGPKFREIVISKYEALLKDTPQVDSDVLILWKYDYCLSLRRSLHLFCKPEHPDINAVESIRKACTVLSEIIDTSHSQIFKARAWAELGQLVYEIEKKPDSLGPNVRECIPIQKRYFSSQRCFDIALELGRGDFDVMEVCAKFFRYFNKAYESVSLFEEALKLRKTTLAYHHLALAIRKIELKKVNAAHQRPPAYNRNRRNIVHTPRSTEKSHLKRTIKCGRKATILPHNEQTEKILHYLKLSLEQDPQNHSAAYDMAFMLRQLQRKEDAKVEFCKLLNTLEIDELKISCYEQAGYCCLDMAEDGGRASKKHTFDAIRFLQKAIEVAAGVAAKVKYSLLDVRPLIPTVRTMLSSPGLWDTNNSQLQRLQDLLLEHGDILPVVQDARSSDMSQTGNLVEKYLQDGDTGKAAFLSILDEIVTENDDNFTQHMTTILDDALTCTKSEDYMSTKTMYQLFFKLLERRIYKEDREYDIFLMTDEESENLEFLTLVSDWLKNCCGIKVINSFEHCEPGQLVLNSLTNFSLSSIAVFLIQKSTDQLEFLVDRVITNIISMPPESPERKPRLVIMIGDEVKLQDAWMNVPTVKLPKTDEEYSDSDISSWLNRAFRLLF